MGKGPKEAELETIVNAGDWEITYLPKLKTSLEAVSITMNTIAALPGWTGTSADSARAAFLARSKQLTDQAKQLDTAAQRIATANQAREKAATQLAALPDATVPSWVHDVVKLLGSAPIAVPIVGPLSFLSGVAGNEAVNLAQNFLEQQREAAAQQALDELKPKLVPPMLSESQTSSSDGETGGGAAGSGSGGGGTGGGSVSGGGSAPSRSPRNPSVPGIPGVPHEPDPSIDAPMTPSNPGGFLPPGGDDPSGGGGGAAPGGLGTGVLGGLAAGGAGLAALSAGGRFGGGGLAGAGTSSLGSGGLLGASGKGAGAGVTAESEGEAASAKPGTPMMGGSGGAGGRGKEKRAGLGGFIAPKLEDDEEFVPRSRGAFAGGRDGASTTDD